MKKRKMTFEIFVYRAQQFAVKWQGTKPGGFFNNLKIALGANITQFLMGMCFVKIYSEGERQWQKQRSVKSAIRK